MALHVVGVCTVECHFDMIQDCAAPHLEFIQILWYSYVEMLIICCSLFVLKSTGIENSRRRLAVKDYCVTMFTK